MPIHSTQPDREAIIEALALAETIIRQLPENGKNWNTISRFWAAVSSLKHSDTTSERSEKVERLRATVIKLCDEFEDATYDTNSGGQSIDRKNLIVECRRAALEDGRT